MALISLGLLAFGTGIGCGDNQRAEEPAATGGTGGRGGSGGAPDAGTDADGQADDGTPPLIFLSEIMYHPVLENAAVDNHEFIEIFNASARAVDLSGWKLSGQVSFTFPKGAAIAAGAYKVIAKNRAALAAISGYRLVESELLGDYSGTLSNTGGTISLKAPGAAGGTIDQVKYSSLFPWPLGADALGAAAPWLHMSDADLATHQYMGRSLERVSFALPSSDLSNWVPSPLDGATPGRPNDVSKTPPAVVDALDYRPAAGSDALIRAADEVTVTVHFVGHVVSEVALEWFVDDVQRDDETTELLAMVAAPDDPSATTFAVNLPPQVDSSIVRFRVLANGGDGQEVISPRPSDPYQWHGYFVTPPADAPDTTYGLYIEAGNWTTLWQNINFTNNNDRRVVPETVGNTTTRCKIRQSWDASVPAVFVFDGQVYDVFVRYQGSRYNRLKGWTIDPGLTTIFPLPDVPVPLLALAWNIEFPRYKRFDGRGTVLLNKLNQSCPGLNATVGERMFTAAGIPVSHGEFVRLFINGGYYSYALDLEQVNEDMIKRFLPTGEQVGDLFKPDGAPLDEGPWGWSDGRVLTTTNCPYTLQERYAYTYQRKTQTWDDPTILMKLLQDLAAARASSTASTGYPELRTFLTEQFDVDKVLTYLAIRNWMEPWDDAYHNYNLYRQANGKWILFPWDLDEEFGEHYQWASNKSFYVGEEGNRDNNNRQWNWIKDVFIKVFRAELGQRMLDLAAPGGPLDPEVVKADVDDAAAQFNIDALAASPMTMFCDFLAQRDGMRSFADQRHAQVMSTFAVTAP